MFEIMKNYGETFTPQWWIDLFKVVFDLLDHSNVTDTQVEVNPSSVTFQVRSSSVN